MFLNILNDFGAHLKGSIVEFERILKVYSGQMLLHSLLHKFSFLKSLKPFVLKPSEIHLNLVGFLLKLKLGPFKPSWVPIKAQVRSIKHF